MAKEVSATLAQPHAINSRRKRIWRWVWLVLLGALALYGLYRWGWIPSYTERLTFYGDSTKLKQSVIIPTLNCPVTTGKNIIWCASFQKAWDELNTSSIGKIQHPLTLVGAETYSKRLNHEAMPPLTDLPSTSYAAAGIGPGIVPTIQSAMQARFPGVSLPAFGDYAPQDILAYCYLEAVIKFPIPFFNAAPMRFAGKRVACFGIRAEDSGDQYDLRSQVHVLYQDRHTFVIDPCYTSQIQVVLACVTPGATLADTIADTERKITDLSNLKDENNKYVDLMKQPQLSEQEMAWLNHYIEYGNPSSNTALGPNDILLIPNMHWSIDHRFSEIAMKDFAPDRYYFLRNAQQTLDFSLNRSGVILTSSAWAKARIKCMPQYFIFDRPFLLYLRMRGHAHPFFAMWVNNTELLTKM